jgi:uncharacterized protein YdaU (DUF1376 family)
MNAQFRWFKFDALTFLLNPAVMVLNLAEQGALVRLMAHASRQQPFASIPADPAQQAAMVGLTSARWGKMAGRVLALWVQQGDRWLCPMMLDLLTADTTTEESPAVTPDRNANAQRQKRYRDNQRNADRNAKSVTRNADTVTQTVTRNAQTVTLEGGKGGDLDLEKELDQEVKKRSSSSASVGASLPEFTSKPAAADAQSLAEAFPDRPASPPADWLALAKADYPQADHSGEWVKFRNHFWPLTGDRRTLAKWQSAWLGWVGRAGSAVPKAATKTAKQPAGAGAAVNAPFQAEIDAMGYRPPTPEEHAQFLREMGETA